MEKYLDTTLSPKERAKDLLGKLSIEEKMAQVNCVFPFQGNDKDVEKAIQYGIGQVSTLQVREMKTREEGFEWQRTLQKKIIENSPHHIPAIFHMEALGGAFIQDAYSIPSGINRGSSWNPELEEKLGETVAAEELAFGVTQSLAPVLDLNRDARMGRLSESYGEDPTLAAALGSAFTKGIQKPEVAGRKSEACAKHFLGSHDTQAGIHGANCDIPERLLKEVYGKPFQAAIAQAGLKSVMPCYCSINGEPASASKHFLTGILREEMGFDGTCISDYGAIGNVYNVQHVTESVTEAGLRCMEAGMDVEMQNCVGFNDELREWFADGRADIEVLNQACLRVLTAKFRMGIFEHPYAVESEEAERIFGNADRREDILQMTRESLILLKNNGCLPMKKNVKKIAVIGCHAKNARIFFGGYTHMSMSEAVLAVANSIAGVKTETNQNPKNVKYIPGTQIQSDETEEFEALLRHQKPDCKNLLEELATRLAGTEIVYSYGYPIAGDDLSGIPAAVEACKGADLILTTLGGKNGSCSVASMGEGVDGTDINLPICQDKCIEALSELGIPMAGIHFNGRPISSDVADDRLDAILEAWSPAECGAEAIVDVLTGVYNPSGRLPVSVAYTAGQLPLYYNHPYGSSYHQGESIGFQNYVDMPHTPRYCFGYGLSYTTFGYSSLHLEEKEVSPSGEITLSFDLTNTGSVAGTETVQLYFSDRQASLVRPVKELAGFAKVYLKEGEKKKVTFHLNPSQFAFLDMDMRWKIEKGAIELQIGSSSEDIRLRADIRVTENAWIPGKERAFYAASEVE